VNGPHQGKPIAAVGEPLAGAHGAVIMVHGRGATPGDILGLAPEIQRPGFAYLAPQAAGKSWYPHSFLAPIEENEPGITSGLQLLDDLLADLLQNDIPPERTILLGFSQGACLALEYVARNARRYGGVAGLSGGLIGPDDAPRNYSGSLDGTAVFLGCSDTDPHIPKERVLETERVLRGMSGVVTTRLYPNMGHMVNRDEIDFVRGMMDELRLGEL
jgi:phospholipase/carboxylesterase